jgi:hypothetical protein
MPSTGVTPRKLTINLAAFAGPVTARWYNPTSVRFNPAADGRLPNRGTQVLSTPGDNGTSTNDWVLVLEAR